jgi:hypothetical protein
VSLCYDPLSDPARYRRDWTGSCLLNSRLVQATCRRLIIDRAPIWSAGLVGRLAECVPQPATQQLVFNACDFDDDASAAAALLPCLAPTPVKEVSGGPKRNRHRNRASIAWMWWYTF